MSEEPRMHGSERRRGDRRSVRAVRAVRPVRPVRAMRAALGLGLGLLLATGAHAAPASVKVTLWLPEGASPVQPAPGGAPVVRPDLDAEQALSIEELGGAIRPEQEQILLDVIAVTPDSEVEEKSHYHFMLAVLQTRLHRHWHQQANTVKAKADAAAASQKAAQHLLKAVKSYKALTDNDAFRNFPRMDEILFYYGYTLARGKRLTEARQVFDRLLKNYPNSNYVPEAHLVFGEYFFEQGQVADAESRYKVVLKFPRSPAYWHAMYKMGWIHLGQQRFQEALETFFQVAQATKHDQKQERLNRAALHDFVRAYAEIGKVDKAHAAFQRVLGSQALQMLQDLAGFYLEQGKSDKAIYVYRELMKLAPAAPDVCVWQYNLARATAYHATAPQVVEICTGDVGPLQEWARVNGVKTQCATCTPTPKRP